MTNREECREFRKIPSLKFLYEVSEDGRIFRNVKSKKQLKIIQTADGYRVVDVTIKQQLKRIYIHCVVAECWLGSKTEGLETEHIDDDKDNNHYSNLRCVTKGEQINMPRHPVLITGQHFESMRAAARWIAERSSKTVDSVMSKLKKRRQFIFGYDVKYLHS